jgi:hypothetical protein
VIRRTCGKQRFLVFARHSALATRHCSFLIGTPSYPSRPLSSNLTPSSPAPAPNYVSFPKLLDFSLTPSKSATSHFLIDNFGACLTRRPPQQSNAEAGELPILSNRPAPRLETLASHRKQTIALISNRPQFAVCNSVAHRRPDQFFRTSNFKHLTSRTLIANETHSRKRLSASNQSTCHFLIANEIHLRSDAFSLPPGLVVPTLDSAEAGRTSNLRHPTSTLRYNGEVESKCNPQGDWK